MIPAADPGRPATLKDVAELAGVNPATASRALSEATRHMVSPETAQRVARAAADLRYVPDHAAASLRTRTSRTVGVLIPDQGSPVWAGFARGVEDELAGAGAGYLALCRSTDSDPARERLILTQMNGRHVEGLIVAGPESAARIAAAAAGLPMIAAGYPPDPGEVPWVAADVAAGAAVLAGYLARLGHRAIGCVAGPGSGQVVSDFTDALAAGSQASAHPFMVMQAQALSAREGFQCCASLLERQRAITAVVATDDMLAAGCCQALAAAGLACPREVSVAGFGDLPFASCLTPSLTTIRVPHYQIGVRAARMLLDWICGSGPPAPQLLQPELVIRNSTAPAASEPSPGPAAGAPGTLIPAGS